MAEGTMALQGKNVVVVGGSSGFGNSVVRLALKEGAHIVIGGRNAERLEQAAAELKKIGPDVQCHVVDATDEQSLRAFFGSIGNFDHLVSTVGGAMGGGFATTDMHYDGYAADTRDCRTHALRQSALGADCGRQHQ